MEPIWGTLLGVFCAGFFFLLFVGLGIFFIYRGVQDRKKSEASQGWPGTMGQVTVSEIRRDVDTDSEGYSSATYTPEVEYTYEVSGQVFTGKKISFGFKTGYGNRSKAEARLANYPEGSQVTVYYDPANPGDAVVERKPSGTSTMMVVGIIFAVIGVCLACPLMIFILSGALSTLG